MKKLFLLALIALSAIFMPSCKKNNQAADNQTYIISTIDGSTDTLKNITTKIINGLGGKPVLFIGGGSSTTSTMMGLDIYIHQIEAPETIDVTKSYYADFGVQDNTGNLYESSNANPSSTGTIIISKNDTTARRVEGTFSGVAVNDNNANDKKTITNGIFKIKY